VKTELCPTCGQQLPKGMTKRDCEQKLEREFEAKSKKREAAAITKGREEGEAKAKEKYEKQMERVAAQAKADGKAEERRAFKVREEGFLKKIDSLQRDGKTANQLGEEGERELDELLKQEWPGDKTERVKRGKKAIDITHIVRNADKNDAGVIILERKTGLNFQTEWITKAKEYRLQHDTPWVVIVADASPSKAQYEACRKNQIRVVKPREVILAVTEMREAILLIAKIRLEGTDADPKAKQLLIYILSNDFKNRFADINGAIQDLIEEQQGEIDWHERRWRDRSKIHVLLESRRRQISAALDAIVTGHSITNGSSKRKAPRRESAGGAKFGFAAD
jgi:hypothetical protein